jgi:very-short-patch-repair endonuclease
VPRAIDTIDGRTPSLLIAMHQMLPEVARRGKPGIQLARAVLAERPPDRVRLTGVERRFEWDLTSAGISVPRRQVNLGGHSWIGRVDYYDDPIKVIYEIDSALHHKSLIDQRNDERRDADMSAAGFNEVVRIDEEDVWYRPHVVRQAVLEARRKWSGRAAA